MNERISALMDGEQERGEFAATLAELREPGDARETWRRYHVISDALRDTRLTSPGFAERVAARLEREPTVLAPPRTGVTLIEPRWLPLYAAASVAAMALVGWIALAPQQVPQSAPIAAAPAKPAAIAAAKAPAQVPLTDAANDYLLAHQAYSPRNSFQGVAPYVRTVTDRPAERRR